MDLDKIISLISSSSRTLKEISLTTMSIILQVEMKIVIILIIAISILIIIMEIKWIIIGSNAIEIMEIIIIINNHSSIKEDRIDIIIIVINIFKTGDIDDA